MAKEYPSAILMLVLAAMLLPGCTMNPQDLSRNVGGAGAPGTAAGGDAQAAGTPGASVSPPAGISLTAGEVARHNTASDCWTIIRGAVLDLSSFTSHPGGDAYVPYCGGDGTIAYEGTPHSAFADSMLQSYTLGMLGETIQAPEASNPAPAPGLQGDGSVAPFSPPPEQPSQPNQTASLQPPPSDGAQLILTLSEVAKHNTASDCWIIIHNIVLNISSFSSHPGGSAYAPYCGRDGTVAYESVPHSANADSWFQYYQIGLLGQAAEPNTNPPPPAPRGGDDEYEDDDDD